jgi:GDP-L-fucose synthase
MDVRSRIFVAGDQTLIGRAIKEQLKSQGFHDVLESGPVDLTDTGSVAAFFQSARPEYVFLTAGRTAGIAGNQEAPADLMIDNLRVVTSVVPAAWKYGARKLLYLSSSCTYPKLGAHPLNPTSLWTGAVEPTSAAYATAKLAGMKLCDAYRQQHGAPFFSAIGADAYGPGDDFDPVNSHVVAALMRRMHEARLADAATVDVWGTGAPLREFIFTQDLADACIFAMRRYDGELPLNLGVGHSTSIRDLAGHIRSVVGFRGELHFDASKPDGMPFKGLDSTRLLEMGWRPRVDLPTGLRLTYDWLLANSIR